MIKGDEESPGPQFWRVVPDLSAEDVPMIRFGDYVISVADARDLAVRLVQTANDSEALLEALHGEDEQAVTAGTILYVAATAEHSFFEIEEELTLLVFFASGGSSEL